MYAMLHVVPGWLDLAALAVVLALIYPITRWLGRTQPSPSCSPRCPEGE